MIIAMMGVALKLLLCDKNLRRLKRPVQIAKARRHVVRDAIDVYSGLENPVCKQTTGPKFQKTASSCRGVSDFRKPRSASS